MPERKLRKHTDRYKPGIIPVKIEGYNPLLKTPEERISDRIAIIQHIRYLSAGNKDSAGFICARRLIAADMKPVMQEKAAGGKPDDFRNVLWWLDVLGGPQTDFSRKSYYTRIDENIDKCELFRHLLPVYITLVGNPQAGVKTANEAARLLLQRVTNQLFPGLYSDAIGYNEKMFLALDLETFFQKLTEKYPLESDNEQAIKLAVEKIFYFDGFTSNQKADLFMGIIPLLKKTIGYSTPDSDKYYDGVVKMTREGVFLLLESTTEENSRVRVRQLLEIFGLIDTLAETDPASKDGPEKLYEALKSPLQCATMSKEDKTAVLIPLLESVERLYEENPGGSLRGKIFINLFFTDNPFLAEILVKPYVDRVGTLKKSIDSLDLTPRDRKKAYLKAAEILASIALSYRLSGDPASRWADKTAASYKDKALI